MSRWYVVGYDSVGHPFLYQSNETKTKLESKENTISVSSSPYEAVRQATLELHKKVVRIEDYKISLLQQLVNLKDEP